jgi:hypothetical protein
MHSRTIGKLLFAGLGAVALLGAPRDAAACGGFFCSQTAPVNQAAERIIFAENGDGTVTAVIQILYQGPAENFSWLLPISTVPRDEGDIAVASNLAFARLQTATNPSYSLMTRVEGTCAAPPPSAPNGGFGGATAAGGAGGAGGGPGNVMVEASGVVGAFEWTVISLKPDLEDPADAAVEWLEQNGYDVQAGARGLIRPYLEDGLYLLAMRLTKGADTGSIRPIALTYEASEPMIPIKLTAVAANDDMGVMTWLLSTARGVPRNYLSLELNDAKINWFNAGSTYNAVVTAAADEAGGQGFVTEFAGETAMFKDRIWTTGEETSWESFKGSTFDSLYSLFQQSQAFFGSYDGFWDAVRSTVTLPDDVVFEDFKRCPNCYAATLEFSPTAYIAALEKNVIEPMRLVQQLIDEHPYMTRLYTTLSAAEMTVDPLFTFNPELEPYSNVHTATRVIECNPSVQQFNAPWRVELPQGGVIRGVGTAWPTTAVAEQPSNFRIVRMSSKGEGAVLEDNTEVIQNMLDEYNGSLAGGTGGSTGTPSGGTGGVGRGGSAGQAGSAGRPSPGMGGGATAGGGRTGMGGSTIAEAGAGEDSGKPKPDRKSDGGCAVPARPAEGAGWLGLALVFGGYARRRRARKSGAADR